MTLDAFLIKLAETPRDWYLDRRRIRRKLTDVGQVCCPVSALDPTGPNLAANYRDAARHLLLNAHDAERLANAADDHHYNGNVDDNRDLRAQLLTACGLPTDAR